METLARFVVRRRWWVVLAWIVAVLGVQLISRAAGGAAYRDVFALPHTESGVVLDLLNSSGQGAQTGQIGTVVIHPRSGTLDATTPPPGLAEKLAQLCGAGLHVNTITSPWGAVVCENGKPVPRQVPSGVPGARNPQLSEDGTVGLVTISWQFNQNAVGNFIGVYDRLHPLGSAQYQYEFSGDAFAALAAQTKGISPELFGIVAALIILAVVFRTLGAAVLPLLSAIAALGVGLGLIALLSHTANVASFATQLATLMVVGVGVDYALFIVTRHRRNLTGGMSVADSIVVAMNTSGRAVLFAGATVCVAILGLNALGVSFLYGVSIGTAIAVALTMVASLTLLPAVLSLIGYKVLPRKIRAAVRDGSYVEAPRATRWARWADFVGRHKLSLGGLAAAVIMVMAIPFLGMRLGHADQGNVPKSLTLRRGYDLIANAKGFGPGYNSTLELVVHGPGAVSPQYLTKVGTALATRPDVNPVSIRPVPLGSDLALLTFKSTTSPQDPRTTALVSRLRSEFAPQLEAGTANRIYVFGATAVYVDFSHVLATKLPLFFGSIVGLSFLLLMVAFRSLVIPLTAAVMNVFAAGASFGVVVAIFQWGWFSEALGIGSGGPIEAFLPVMFFAILFGLSMDYQVFLVSRMHEEWVRSHDNARAVRVGQGETGGIITAAACIMIAVFGGFAFADSRVIQLFGIGLGAAIFIDAFILRTVLVPALMHALGNWNWYYPGWLERITPRVSVEPPRASPEDETVPVTA
jgi:RND superfamily putative drug exporter